MEPFRVLPRLDDKNEFFWTSGRDGRLRFLCCQECDYFIHPPSPVCPRCWSRAVAPRPVSGQATVHSFTVNHQRWSPDINEPYVIGLVQLAEQEDLRLTTNIVNVAIEGVSIGMDVRVTFEDHDPIFVPLFEPAAR
jgi:hypothetical protein